MHRPSPSYDAEDHAQATQLCSWQVGVVKGLVSGFRYEDPQ